MTLLKLGNKGPTYPGYPGNLDYIIYRNILFFGSSRIEDSPKKSYLFSMTIL